METKQIMLEKKTHKQNRKQFLANLIKEELTQLTGVELSELTGLSRSSISRMHTCSESLSLDKIEKNIKIIQEL